MCAYINALLSFDSHRWAKLRFAMVPHTILLEPLSECFVLGILAAWSINFLFKIDPFAIYLFHILVWFLLDYTLLNVIQVGLKKLIKINC